MYRLAGFAALALGMTTPAQAQIACPPGMTVGSLTMDIVKMEQQGGPLTLTYLLQSSYNNPMDIHPYHWGHDRHVVRDSNGYEWTYVREMASRPNPRMENGDLQRGTINFTLAEGEPGSNFNILLTFQTIPSGGGVRLGQSRKIQGRWTNVPANCTTKR